APPRSDPWHSIQPRRAPRPGPPPGPHERNTDAMPQITVTVREPTGKLDEKTNVPKYAPKTYTYTVTNQQADFYHQWDNYLAQKNIDLEPKAEQQVHDMIKKGDFALLHALTDVIRKAKGDAPNVAITADLNIHKVGIWKVTDFPYLNKNRLGSTNR